MHRLGVIMAAAGVVLLAGAVVIYRTALGQPPRPEAPPASTAVASAPPPVPPVVPPVSVAPEPVAAPPPPSPRESSRRALAAPEKSSAPAPTTTGTLTVTADVAGAQVFVDRRFVGAAPVTVSDLAPGSHQLNVSAPGYEPIVQTIDITPGPRDIAVRFREVRLNLTLAVVHKHRLGSCNGRLLATPEGLRYETSDKNDAFSAALLELETFQVDYLAKTLRIQPRRGRRYDFTDPEGNADRLFVFHRDVEKAREQLRKGDTP